MSEWQESKLENLGILQRGRSRHRPRYAFHLYGGEYPFIQTGEIRTARKYIRNYEQTYSEAGLAQSKLWRDLQNPLKRVELVARTAKKRK